MLADNKLSVLAKQVEKVRGVRDSHLTVKRLSYLANRILFV